MTYIGVTWKARSGNYEAMIRPLGTYPKLSLGRFLDSKSAARAYDAAARLLHRGQATLNFPDWKPSDEMLQLIATRILTRKNCPVHIQAMMKQHLTTIASV